MSPYSPALELQVTSVSAQCSETDEHEDGRVKTCPLAFYVLKSPAALSSATSTTKAGSHPPWVLQGGRKGIVRAQVDLRRREKKETSPIFLVVHSFLLILPITVVIMRTMRGEGREREGVKTAVKE